MNVSMQDTFNLGWKLVHVLQGRSDASLLRSYSRERLTEARRLVETDHEWARIMSAPTTQAERDGTEEPRIIRQFKQNLEFTGGTAVKYDPSTLIRARRRTRRSRRAKRSAAASTRRRWCDCPTPSRCSSATRPRPTRAGASTPSPARPTARTRARRSTGWRTGWRPDPKSPVVKHTRKGEDIDAVIDFRAVFQQTFDQLAYENMPSLLKPKTGKLGLQDHEKVFCVDHKGVGDIFDMRGIDRESGCMVVVRPDQYIAHVAAAGRIRRTGGVLRRLPAVIRREPSSGQDVHPRHTPGCRSMACAPASRGGDLGQSQAASCDSIAPTAACRCVPTPEGLRSLCAGSTGGIGAARSGQRMSHWGRDASTIRSISAALSRHRHRP